MRPDDRAVPVDSADVRRVPVMREDELAARSGPMIGTEEQPSQRIGVDVAFKSHRGAALNVQDDPVPVVEGRRDRFRAYCPGQVEEIVPVELVQPRQGPPKIAGVYPSARDVLYVRRLTRQDRCAREVPEISSGGGRYDLLLPICGELAGQVECGPTESWRHQARPVEGSSMRVGELCSGKCEITAARSDRTSCPPSVIPHGCLGQLRAHRVRDACKVLAGVPHPRRDLAHGVVRGQTAALAVEGIVLGSATTATSWGRSARSDTVRTDGRSA